MSKAGTFPPLQPIGHTTAKVIRATENDLAWSNRPKGTNSSPRVPTGSKPPGASPRSRIKRVGQMMDVSREPSSSLLVQTGNAVSNFMTKSKNSATASKPGHCSNC